MYYNKKSILTQFFSCLMVVSLFIGLFIGTFFVGKIFGMKSCGKTLFTDKQSIEVSKDWENPYENLVDDEIAFYIIEVCKSLKFDPDIVVAILLKENPNQNKDAINKNLDGSVDIGMFQINSKNIVCFAELYWPFDKYKNIESNLKFDIFNWQHNTYIAIMLIKDLYNSFNGDLEKVASAYNAGISRTIKGNLPQSTLAYKKEVLNNYIMLKSWFTKK